MTRLLTIVLAGAGLVGSADTLDSLHGERRLDADADEWTRMEAEVVGYLDYEVREMSLLALSRLGPVEP
jgi:hypothetical protein